jgi:hypothetical protein
MISCNPNLTMEFINSNLDKNFIWAWISENPSMTMEIIEANPDKPWNWSYISHNPNLTMEFIQENPDKEWDWLWISEQIVPLVSFPTDKTLSHPNLTMDMIEENPDKQWNWSIISGNPNLTFQMIEENPDKPWEWYYISSNLFTREKELFELRILRIKQHQQFVQDYLFEEFVKIAVHPAKINKYLDMGYTIDELDSIM